MRTREITTHSSFLILLPACLLASAPLLAEDRAQPGAPGSVTTLSLSVVEGEGAVHQAGSRASVPLTVQVADEVGRPVAGVAVSFLMPANGPAGIFASGLSTEVLTTGKDGRASVRGIRWGHTPGQARIRITAAKEQARAGAITTQYIQAVSDDPDARTKAVSVSKPKGKWIAIAVLAAGAAVGGVALGMAGSSTASSTPAAAGAVTDLPGVQVGVPTITVGKP